MLLKWPGAVRASLTLLTIVTGLSFYVASAQAQTITGFSVMIQTGEDNLRGGNDNAFFSITTRNGFAERKRQINDGNRGLRRGERVTKEVVLRNPVPLSEIEDFVLFVEGFTGGVGGDNWNVFGFVIDAYTSDGRRLRLARDYGGPVVRFTNRRRTFTKRIRPTASVVPGVRGPAPEVVVARDATPETSRGPAPETRSEPISCQTAKRLVRRAGYKKVREIECSGPSYTFRAKRHGHRLSVAVDAHTRTISEL